MLTAITKRDMIIIPAGTINNLNPNIISEIDIVIGRFIKSVISMIITVAGHHMEGPLLDLK
jgi:hypothetical protein